MARAQLNKANLDGSWTPNQQAKREQILDAAAKVMTRSGVAACTARAVADVGPFTTSALHYYFDNIEEIVDLAFRRIMSRFQVRIREAAAREADPIDALWAAANTYAVYGSEWSDPEQHASRERAPMLWFEYQAECLRAGSLDTLREISAAGVEFFERLARDAGLDDFGPVASTLYSALLGSAIRDSLFHRDPAELLGELSHVIGIPPSPKYCKR